MGDRKQKTGDKRHRWEMRDTVRGQQQETPNLLNVRNVRKK